MNLKERRIDLSDVGTPNGILCVFKGINCMTQKKKDTPNGPHKEDSEILA